MIGLEYILQLYGTKHQDLAENLGIRKQNINLWIKEKQNISKKYLPELSKIFGVDESYFQKELDEVDKLVIQKEKLKRELKPTIIKYDPQLTLGEDADLIDKPVYSEERINEVELEITKAKAVEDYRNIISTVKKDVEFQKYEQLNMIFEKYGNDSLVNDVIDALSHHYNVLPDWVGDPNSDDFVDEFLELIDKYYTNGDHRVKIPCPGDDDTEK